MTMYLKLALIAALGTVLTRVTIKWGI